MSITNTTDVFICEDDSVLRNVLNRRQMENVIHNPTIDEMNKYINLGGNKEELMDELMKRKNTSVCIDELVNVYKVNIDKYDIFDQCKLGNLHLVKKFIESGGDINGRQGYTNKTLLHRAANYSHLAIITYLLENGADVNVLDSWGDTPLKKAMMRYHYSIIKILFENGADPDLCIRNSPGGPAREWLSSRHSPEIKALFVN